jgi:hypothetical protein
MKKVIILISIVAATLTTFAQHEAIDKKIDSVLISTDFDSNEDIDILKTDIAYSIEKLYGHRNDSVYLMMNVNYIQKEKTYNLIMQLFNNADTAHYEAAFKYALRCAQDSTVKRNYYNSIVHTIRKTILSERPIPYSARQFIASPEFYSEVENLKTWERAHLLKEFEERQLLLVLLRLGDVATTDKYVKVKPYDAQLWKDYIDGLKYAMTQPAVTRFIYLLDSKDKVKNVPWNDPNDDYVHYSTARSYALQKLSEMVENFPFEVDIPYNWDTHFSDLPEEDFKKAKRWFKDNPDYKIIRKSNYNY